MQEIITFYKTLPIRPLLFSFFLYAVFFSVLLKVVTTLFFFNDLKQPALVLNATAGGLILAIANYFGEHRFKKIAGDKSDQSEQWLLLQNAIRTETLPRQSSALQSLPVFLDMLMRIRFKSQFYGSGALFTVATINGIIAFGLKYFVLLAPAGLFLIIGISMFFLNARKLRKIKRLERLMRGS